MKFLSRSSAIFGNGFVFREGTSSKASCKNVKNFPCVGWGGDGDCSQVSRITKNHEEQKSKKKTKNRKRDWPNTNKETYRVDVGIGWKGGWGVRIRTLLGHRKPRKSGREIEPVT